MISKIPEPRIGISWDKSICEKRIEMEEKFKYMGPWVNTNLPQEVKIRPRVEQ